jgi:group II intron reverse transcriptase/maturase
MVFTTLNPALDLALLKEAYRRTRKDGATGVDGQTAAEYSEHLEENLRSLLDRAKSGLYRAPPVRRVHIPKDKAGETRPLGIPTFEDKVLQRAVAMVLEAVYEVDFHPVSYGFRPGRSAHQMLHDLWRQLQNQGGGWVLEADIRTFFDSVDHQRFREVLARRVRDGVITRLIGKWLKAGVFESGQVSYPERGTPQGGVISPLLANIFLHEVLDEWWVRDVQPRLRRGGHLYRYADDFVALFLDEGDARRVMDVLPKRFEKYGLTIHPDKTRLVRFQAPRKDGSGPKPGQFDLLGFTHRWQRSRKGVWVVRKVTAPKRFRRGLLRLSQWLRKARYLPIGVQRDGLVRRLQGHYGYYGLTGNSQALGRFRWAALSLWRHWLRRRSQRAPMPWDRFKRLLRHHPVPEARAVHSIYARAASH